LGLLKFDVLDKKLLTTSNDISFFYDNTFLYKIEPFKNLIFKYNKPPLINEIIKSSYIEDENVFIIEKVIVKTMENEIITLDGGFLNYPIEESKLYNIPFNYLNVIFPILILIPILYLISV